MTTNDPSSNPILEFDADQAAELVGPGMERDKTRLLITILTDIKNLSDKGHTKHQTESIRHSTEIKELLIQRKFNVTRHFHGCLTIEWDAKKPQSVGLEQSMSEIKLESPAPPAETSISPVKPAPIKVVEISSPIKVVEINSANPIQPIIKEQPETVDQKIAKLTAQDQETFNAIIARLIEMRNDHPSIAELPMPLSGQGSRSENFKKFGELIIETLQTLGYGNVTLNQSGTSFCFASPQ